MKMKALLTAAVAGLAMASAAEASTLTYVLSLNDNGTGVKTMGSYAVYAYTSAGDNAGIASYQTAVVGAAGTFGTILNLSPTLTFTDSSFTNSGASTGYSLTRTAQGTVVGGTTTGAFDTVSGAGVVRYGIGQTAGNLNTVAIPDGYDGTSGGPTAYGVSTSFITANATGTQTDTGGQVPVLINRSTFTVAPTLTVLIPSQAGNLFTGNGMTAIAPTTVNYITRDLNAVPEPTTLAAFGLVGAGLISRRRKAAAAV